MKKWMASVWTAMSLMCGMAQATETTLRESPRLVVQAGHSGRTLAVAFSSDGKTAASGSVDMSVKLWDVIAGRELRTLIGHGEKVEGVIFSPDGKTLASWSSDRNIKLWDVASGHELRTLVRHRRAPYRGGVAFSPDGTNLAYVDRDGTVKQIALATDTDLPTLDGAAPQSGFTPDLSGIAYSPDGTKLATGSVDGTLRILDVATGRALQSMTHGQPVECLAFSPDGRHIASGGGERIGTSAAETIKIWDVKTGLVARSLTGEHIKLIRSLSFAPDGKMIVAVGARGVKLLRASTGQELMTLDHFSSGIVSAVFSPDGRLLLSAGGAQAAVNVWDVHTAKMIRTLGGSGVMVRSIAFSRDSQQLSFWNQDQTIKSWNLTSGQLLGRFAKFGFDWGSADRIAFSPDDKTVAGAVEGHEELKIWETNSGQLPLSLAGQVGKVNSVAYSPNGGLFASGGDNGMITVWNASTRRKLFTLTGHGAAVQSIAFSKSGKMLVSGSRDRTVRLWDLVTGRELSISRGHRDNVNSVAFSPDEKTVLSGGEDGLLKLWSVASGAELRNLSGHTDAVISVAFAPNGKSVASGAYDKTVKIWNIATGQLATTLSGHQKDVRSVAFSADSQLLASGSYDGTIRLWNVATSREVRTLAGREQGVQCVAFSPDGRTFVAASDDKIKLFDVATGQLLRTFSGLSGHMIWSLAFAPDGKTVIAGDSDAAVRIWDVSNGGDPRILSGHGRQVNSVAFAPDGKTVLSGSSDQELRLWNVVTGKLLRKFVGHKNAIICVAFSPDGLYVASTSYDNTLRLWDALTGKELRTFSLDDDRGTSIAFSPDGQSMLLGGKSGTVKHWNISSGELLATFSGHHGAVNSVAFSPDGKTALSGGDDHTLRMWDAASGRERYSLESHSDGVKNGIFSPNGKLVASSSDDKTIKLWRAADGKLLASLTSFADGAWAVTDAEGRFDVSDLENMPHLHWILADDPLTPLPIEIFMRDYYEPGLLTRVLNGEKLRPVRALAELNLLQPTVRIAAIEPDPKRSDYVRVTVESAGVSGSKLKDGVPISTGVHDLRLFRNGQMVGYAPGPLALAGAAPFQRIFSVRLPGGKTPLDVSAYAFNDSGIKSATAHLMYAPPVAIAASQPRAYLINIGVNQHENPAWDLRYAANDADQIGKSLVSLLEKQGRYSAVVSIPLISGAEGKRLATKANLKAVLNALAGRVQDLSGIPGGEQLRQAAPDDLLLISFSGHGYSEGGVFYLVPGDTGAGSGRGLTPSLISHSISSDELSAWLSDIDAGDMAMIVDACHSAASVGDEFKPGPMGSRGLGQMAFDKGMRILAASQAGDVALESDLIKQGLLSFALVQNGLRDWRADYLPWDQSITLKEWLSYGVDRVPLLAQEVRAGKLVEARGDDRGATIISDGGAVRLRAIQQPSLFDFTKGRRDLVLKDGN